MSKFNQILNLQLFKVKTSEIYGLTLANPKRDEVFKRLPKYVIRDNGKVDLAACYLQFVGTFAGEKEEEYIMFDVYSMDPFLEAESEGGGLDYFLNNDVEMDWTVVFAAPVTFRKLDDRYKSLYDVDRLVFQLEYIGGYWCGSEYLVVDMEASFVKILEL